MGNPKMRIGFREIDIDTNRPLVDGTVKVEGFDLEISKFRGPEFVDAWDASFGGLMDTKANGDHPYVSIPAFPNRKFRLAYIAVNSKAGISSPRDLEGKRVGMYASNNTAGIWARGALQNYYGVDFTRVNWFMPGPHAKSWGPGIKVTALPKSASTSDVMFNELLVNGELDAVLGPNILKGITYKDPRIRRLFPNYKLEEQNYFKATGIFPISHVVTLKQDFVAKYPHAPLALLKAYRRASEVAFDRICGSDPEIVTSSWAAAAIDEQRAIMGDDYWTYSIKENVRTLEAMMLYAHQFGITPVKLDYKIFFDPAAAELPHALASVAE